jgi:nucleotide-binding universal stress UspA family protein
MNVQPKRILWPTDFSPLARHAARYARAFCEHFDAELHAVHIVVPPMSTDVSVTMPADMPIEFDESELLESCRKRLDECVADAFAGLPHIVCQVFLGNSWPAICDYATQAEIDLLIIATHARTGLKHVMFGSTAERIVQHAPCPVLVVKTPEREFVSD